MTTRSSPPPARHHLETELSVRLSDLLCRRDQGLLTQREFEDELDQVRSWYPRAGSISESGLRCGGTRFVVREAVTGAVLVRMEFRRAYAPDV